MQPVERFARWDSLCEENNLNRVKIVFQVVFTGEKAVSRLLAVRKCIKNDMNSENSPFMSFSSYKFEKIP